MPNTLAHNQRTRPESHTTSHFKGGWGMEWVCEPRKEGNLAVWEAATPSTVAWTWLLVVSPGQWMSAYVSAFCSVLPRGTYLDAQESGYVLALGSQGVELLGTWWAPSFWKMSPWSVRLGLHFSCWYYMTRSSWPQLVDIGLDTQMAKKIFSFGNLKLDQRLSLGGWLSSNLPAALWVKTLNSLQGGPWRDLGPGLPMAGCSWLPWLGGSLLPSYFMSKLFNLVAISCNQNNFNQ